MPVPSDISDLSQTAGSNSPLGSENPNTADDYLRAYAAFIAEHRDGKGYSAEVDVASAATCDIGGANSFLVRITGTTTITSFGTNYEGARFIRFADALTLTHNASTLILPGGANIATAAGDTCIVTPISGGWVVSNYQRAAGGGKLLGVQVFTSTGTYTPTTGTQSVVVEVQGGGGGSGGCVATTAGQWSAGRPGAGGGYGRKRITSGFSGVTVTVGAGGTAAAAGDNTGGLGGTSSFGAHISCGGGAGGGGSGTAQTTAGVTGGLIASGGTVTGADYGRPGSSPATPPFAPTVGTLVLPAGGASYFGAGGLAVALQNNNASGSAGTGYGGGASGPGNPNGAFAAAAGSAGAPGIVIVWEYA